MQKEKLNKMEDVASWLVTHKSYLKLVNFTHSGFFFLHLLQDVFVSTKSVTLCKAGPLVFYSNIAVLLESDSVTIFGRHNQWGIVDDN